MDRASTHAEDTRNLGNLPSAKEKTVETERFVDTEMHDRGDGRQFVSKEFATVPRVWKSSADHEPAMLAYITVREAKKLRELDMHKSGIGKTMHYGPGSVPSFQGDGSDYGGGYGSDTDSYSGGGGDQSPADYSAQFDTTAPTAQELADFQAALDAMNAQAEANANNATNPFGYDPWAGVGPPAIGPSYNPGVYDPPSAIDDVLSQNGGWSNQSTEQYGPWESKTPFLDRINDWLQRNVLQNIPVAGSLMRGGQFLTDLATRNGLNVQFGGPPPNDGGGAGGSFTPSLGGGVALQQPGQGSFPLLGSSGGQPFGGFSNAGPFLGDANYKSYGINY